MKSKSSLFIKSQYGEFLAFSEDFDWVKEDFRSLC